MSEDVMPQVPDPNGPPVISYASKSLVKRTAAISVTGTLGAGATVLAILVVGAAVVTQTSGAMRSHRITWEERQKEIAEARAESESCEAASSNAPEQAHE